MDRSHAILWDPGYATLNTTRLILAAFTMGMSGDYTYREPTALPTIPSAFGNLQPYIKSWGYEECDQERGPNLTMSWYGVACDLYRTSGFADLVRAVPTARDWNMSSSRFDAVATKTPSVIYPLSERIVPYQVPTGSVIGFGQAMGAFAGARSDTEERVNMTAYAQAFLYASVAIENIMLNLASSNHTRALRLERYPVAGHQSVLRYRTTYTRGVLVFGLVTLTLCAAIIVGMLVYSRRSISSRSTEVVDGLRFVLDFAVAVREDEALVDASTWSRARLEKWAGGLKFRYTVAKNDVDGRECEGNIQLVQTG
jgi:hypothetical protein